MPRAENTKLICQMNWNTFMVARGVGDYRKAYCILLYRSVTGQQQSISPLTNVCVCIYVYSNKIIGQTTTWWENVKRSTHNTVTTSPSTAAIHSTSYFVRTSSHPVSPGYNLFLSTYGASVICAYITEKFVFFARSSIQRGYNSEKFALLGYYAASSGNFWKTFRENLSVSKRL
jgi:hypothetical protein